MKYPQGIYISKHNNQVSYYVTYCKVEDKYYKQGLNSDLPFTYNNALPVRETHIDKFYTLYKEGWFPTDHNFKQSHPELFI